MFSLSLKYNGHVGTRKISPYIPVAALDMSAHSALVCLQCAAPFSNCPTFNTAVVRQQQQQQDRLVVDVNHCWCLGCERAAQTLSEALRNHSQFFDVYKSEDEAKDGGYDVDFELIYKIDETKS